MSNPLILVVDDQASNIQAVGGVLAMANYEVMQALSGYVRMNNSDALAHSSGLGLAIAKEELDRMGRHLWYEERDGGGACFSFVLQLTGQKKESP